mmetsp:Transcript_143820/g.248955  ORF Transcript_143820/g.248955 Transcript_143820/m.248955 type:complete len:282 (+) Transcript_143820:3252-4097(+)
MGLFASSIISAAFSRNVLLTTSTASQQVSRSVKSKLPKSCLEDQIALLMILSCRSFTFGPSVGSVRYLATQACHLFARKLSMRFPIGFSPATSTASLRPASIALSACSRMRPFLIISERLRKRSCARGGSISLSRSASPSFAASALSSASTTAFKPLFHSTFFTSTSANLPLNIGVIEESIFLSSLLAPPCSMISCFLVSSSNFSFISFHLPSSMACVIWVSVSEDWTRLRENALCWSSSSFNLSLSKSNLSIIACFCSSNSFIFTFSSSWIFSSSSLCLS